MLPPNNTEGVQSLAINLGAKFYFRATQVCPQPDFPGLGLTAVSSELCTQGCCWSPQANIWQEDTGQHLPLLESWHCPGSHTPHPAGVSAGPYQGRFTITLRSSVAAHTNSMPRVSTAGISVHALNCPYSICRLHSLLSALLPQWQSKAIPDPANATWAKNYMSTKVNCTFFFSSNPTTFRKKKQLEPWKSVIS